MRKIMKKKGFTIVELVIVIAVIAILAAVLIPTFSKIIRKANVSNDTQIVRNLNTALLAEIDKPATMYDALVIAEKAGFIVGNINAKASGNKIAYDSKNNVFCYYNDDNVEGNKIEYIPNSIKSGDAIIETGINNEYYKLWVISNTVSDKFSTYLYNYKGDSTIDTSKGLDVGNETNITQINYTHTSGVAQDVVIRTNSANTSLTINAPSDIVKHYDAVGSLNIIAVANASYHEFGQVAFAEIKTGRIVLESASNVEHIHLSTSEVDEVTVFNNIVIAKASDVEMPEFSRDPVEIPAEGKLVVALQDGTDTEDEKEYVWLTAVGVYEQVVVSNQKDSLTADGANNSFAAASDDQEKRDTAQQIANNITFQEGGEDYKVSAKTSDGGATWTYEVVDKNGNASADYTATKDANANTVEVKTSGENPEAVVTTKENGLNEESKNNLKDDLVITAKADEQIGEQLLGIKTVSINNESIDVYLPVNTSDGSLDLDDIKNSTLVPFNFNFAGGVSFIAPESINEEWNNATADFVISFNKDIEPINSFDYKYNNVQHEASSENYKILPVIGVGKFGNNATSFWEKYKNMWLPCPITSDGYKANEEIALLEDVFTSVGFDGVSVNCQELVNYIKEFSCGLVFLQDIGEVTITVKLVVTNNNTKYVVGSREFTFNSSDYVTTCPSGTYPAE